MLLQLNVLFKINLKMSKRKAQNSLDHEERTANQKKAKLDLGSWFDNIWQGKIDEIKGYIEQGGDINAIDQGGFTALIYAAGRGYKEVVAVLLEFGANIKHADTPGRTALMYAAKWGRQDVVGLLLGRGAGVNNTDANESTALIASAGMGHKEIVELLLEFGASTDHADLHNRTALMYAANNGRNEVVETLLESGANIEHADVKGTTALIYAAKKGFNEVIKTLISHEVNIEHADIQSATALMFAVINNHKQVVETLLEGGANIEHADVKGTTVLIYATLSGCKELVQVLLTHRPDVNHSNEQGVTALMSAAQKGHKGVVEILLEAEADVNHSSKKGTTVLMSAVQKGHKEVVEILLEAAADVACANIHGWTALMSAEYFSYVQISNLIKSAINTDRIFAREQYNQIIVDTQQPDLFISRYKSLLIKHGFTGSAKYQIEQISKMCKHHDIQEALIFYIQEGCKQIDLCCAQIFDALFPELSIVSPIATLLDQVGIFKIVHENSLRQIQVMESFYTKMGYDIDFQNLFESKEEGKEEGKEEVHKANVFILSTNIEKFIAKASSTYGARGDEAINNLQDLRKNYVLPKALLKNLDKALKNYDEHISNPISALAARDNAGAIAQLKHCSMQQEKKLAEQQQEIDQMKNQLAFLLNQFENNGCNDPLSEDVDIGGDVA